MPEEKINNLQTEVYDAAPVLKNRSKRGISAINRWWAARQEISDFKTLYRDRNSELSIYPLLDGMGVEYTVVDRLVLVLSTPDTRNRLAELGFQDSHEALPSTLYFKKLLASTKRQYTRRVYNSGYNIEIHLVGKERWNDVLLAKHLFTKLEVADNSKVGIFFKLFFGLAEMEETYEDDPISATA